MPLFEFVCPICLEKIERYVSGNIVASNPICKTCGQSVEMEQVVSVPAKRNPDKGIQR